MYHHIVSNRSRLPRAILHHCRCRCLQAWRPRYGILKAHVLYLFSDAETLKLKGIIHLKPGSNSTYSTIDSSSMTSSSKGATIKPLREDNSSSSGSGKGISGAYFFDRVSDIVDDAVGIFVGDQLMPSSNSNTKQRERAQLAAAAIRSRQEVSAILHILIVY
jgi:hypothetical protein